MTTDPTPSLLILVVLPVVLLVGIGLVLLRLFEVFRADWVAYAGFAVVVASWATTRRLTKIDRPAL